MSMASGWVMNCLGSAPVGSAGFASAMGAGAGGSSFFPHPARNVVDAAILVIATKKCRCMVALSLDGRVRGVGKYHGRSPGFLALKSSSQNRAAWVAPDRTDPFCWELGAAPILLLGDDRQQYPPGPGSHPEFAAALGLPDPDIPRFFRLYVESQAAPFIDDLAANSRRPIEINQHQLVAAVD